MERTLKQLPPQDTQVDHPLWLRAYAALCGWQRNRCTRRHSRQLADAGITEAQRQAEVAKPFWR